MAASSDRMVIPLERISYVTTPTLTRKDLVQWTHISGRPDLSLVVEKESCKTTDGYSTEQTFLKIKEGITLVDTAVLEEFVCQALLAEQCAASSPLSPRSFAIFVNCPDLAFRYQLITGEFRKIQLLFRNETGFESTINILKQFNLPLTERSSKTKRGKSASAYAQTLSENISRRPSTVFSGPQQSVSVSSVIAPSLNDAHESNQSIYHRQPYTTARSQNSQAFPSLVLRPGPSLAESSLITYQQQGIPYSQNGGAYDNAMSRSHMDQQNFHGTQYNDLLPTSRTLNRAISFSPLPNSPRNSINTLNAVNGPSWLSRSAMANDNPPLSSQKRLRDVVQESQASTHDGFVDERSQPSGTKIMRNDEVSPITTAISHEATVAIAPKKLPGKRNRGTSLQQEDYKKPVSRTRMSKKVFTVASTQTVTMKSQSITTQTHEAYSTNSVSVQTDPITINLEHQMQPVLPSQDKLAALVHLIRGESLHHSISRSRPSDKRDTYLPGSRSPEPINNSHRKCPRVNKFGRHQRSVMPLLSSIQKSLMLGRTNVRCPRTNKFKSHFTILYT